MDYNLTPEEEQIRTFVQQDGVNNAERYLKLLCDRTFLSLWSHVGLYNDKGKREPSTDGKLGKLKGHGQEVCDLLVVFENNVIIFSDKDCKYKSSSNPILDWTRWYREAIKKSADQIWGAERWITNFPDRLFLDRGCQIKFPINLPATKHIQFHRVLVAHGVARRCLEVLGGSGSLKIIPDIVGSMHDDSNASFPEWHKGGIQPFVVGQIRLAAQ